MTKNGLEMKGDYFAYTSSSWSITEQSQDMSLEAGTEGLLPWLAQFAFLHDSEPPAQGWHCPCGLCPAALIFD